MSIWRQIALTLVVVLVAATVWARFYPGAGDQLARWGVDWLPFATAGSPPQETAGAQAPRRAPGSGVVTAPVVEVTINDRLQAIGTGRAVRSVEVTPYASGRMVELLARSGTPVKRGDVIAKLDSEAEQIAAERAAIALKDTEARLERMQALRKSRTATLVQVTDAELAVGNARLELREAELALSRRSVESPIDGIVGILPITAGNYVTSSTVIATVDDRSEILIDFWVPERYASSVTVGAPLTASSVARPGETFPGEVSAVDNRIDSASRTLQVQARIDNTADRLRAGMSFQVNMRFAGDRFRAVSPLAVQWGTDGAYVWAVREGRAHRVPVAIIQRNANAVLVDAQLSVGEPIVIEGLHLVREGSEVTVIGQESGSAVSRKPAPGASGS
ncbi:MAG: efflux transporter periplasmic adaptor subunit [Stappia sp.]|jgi:RND family efflux transporter MFP subunit|uniref:efflux RND transporter periplasmic adaptor subunit n=1 Tax=Stappia sp. TaxID=1870903 RepID=UPI000C3CF0ED|nr:efflux RND transporter periplasmic adaptor subunit [Stappia sp.]MAA96825.1 efflux transporter periplasmic adaptor subunit [Stappia sp.]MBM21133.1 efflux transporter periplasmic adaptor subunit [Stappia sp.]